MKNAQNALTKKLYSDTILTCIITGVIAVLSAVRLTHFIIAINNARIAGAAYTGTAPESLLSDALLFMFVAVTMLLLSLILREIHSTGKPFSRKNVNRLRAMAVLLIIASMASEFAKMISYFLDLTATGAVFQVFTLSGTRLCFMFFGVVCGLISEIFLYGCELQDSMDSIA